jgi:hypothetical protein
MDMLLKRKTTETTDLNLSYNPLNFNLYRKEAESFLLKLQEFLHSSTTIAHLELSGMDIGKYSS